MLDESIDRLLRVINLTLDERMDGARLASGACQSRFHFQREFRKLLGETPGSFRRRLLLERAAYQLSTSPIDVTTLAFDAGYESLEGFSRSFRRAFSVSPSQYRRVSPTEYRLPAPSRIHFDANRSAVGPAMQKGERTVDLTTRLIDHDLWLTRKLLEHARTLSDAQLDAPLKALERPLPFEAAQGTLRSLLDRLVATKENWNAAFESMPAPHTNDASVEGMLARMETSFAAFAGLVRSVADAGRWNDTFVDALCAPPETFTYGGMIAHVVTFSAYRRLEALKAMEGMGVTGLGYGDPIEWERTVP